MTKQELLKLIDDSSKSDKEVREALDRYMYAASQKLEEANGKPEFNEVTGQEMQDLDEISEKLRQFRPQILAQIRREVLEGHKGCCTE